MERDVRGRHTRVRIALRVEGSGEDSTTLGVTKDLSQTGLFLQTERRWQVGHEMEIRIVHSTRCIKIRARVARQDSNGVGLQFINLTDEQTRAIRDSLIDLLARGAWFDDRRKALRVSIQGPITWSDGKREVESELIDLSPRGARIEADDPPLIGTKIMVYVPSPDDNASDDMGRAVCGCQAIVAHRSSAAFGVHFIEPTKEFAEAIRHILVEGWC